jgi:hypothetical protein
MALPRMNAETSLSRPHDFQGFSTEYTMPQSGGLVTPQVCVSSACLRLPSGRFCVNLPILGRRCVTIPRLGAWRIRCCTKFLPPFISCGISRC